MTGRDGGRFDVLDDGLVVVEANLSKREAWNLAGRDGRSVEPHEHTPDCGHGGWRPVG